MVNDALIKSNMNITTDEIKNYYDPLFDGYNFENEAWYTFDNESWFIAAIKKIIPTLADKDLALGGFCYGMSETSINRFLKSKEPKTVYLNKDDVLLNSSEWGGSISAHQISIQNILISYSPMPTTIMKKDMKR